ncbi:MAG: glycosyltransferase family 39 protein [Acidobacteriota bacterium]
MTTPSASRRLRPWLPATMIAVLWCLGFPALQQYNVTWDEALGDFFFGERYLSFFLSFDPAYLDFEANPYPEDREPDLGRSPFRIRPWEYYPVANTLAAGTSEVLSRRLGWLDGFDGFHAFNLILGALFLWVYFAFLDRRFGALVATSATILLFTAPRVVVHMMSNIKDFPLMAMFGLCAIAFLLAFESGSVRALLAAGVLLGLTLGTKANALFFPAIPALVWLAGGTPKAWDDRRRLLLGLLAAGATSVAVLYLTWPYLWGDPIRRYWEHFQYLSQRGGYISPESLAPVLEAILFTTPPVLLAFFAVGLVPCISAARRGERGAVLLLAWAALVLGRVLLPFAGNFDGVRHFLELFPALAAIAGLGVGWTVERLAGFAAARGARIQAAVRTAALAAVLLPGAWATVASHPFQIAYWNVFAGGLPGARAADQPQASDYWGTSYRLGMEWLNENAPENAKLVVPVVEHAVRLVAPQRLRDDILLLPVTTPFSPRIAPERLRWTLEAAAEGPVYVMFVERRDWMNALMADCLNRLEPEVTWHLEGEPILRIYRYTPPP